MNQSRSHSSYAPTIVNPNPQNKNTIISKIRSDPNLSSMMKEEIINTGLFSNAVEYTHHKDGKISCRIINRLILSLIEAHPHLKTRIQHYMCTLAKFNELTQIREAGDYDTDRIYTTSGFYVPSIM